MAELFSIARPYAQAVFELARSSGDYTGWSQSLSAMAQVSRDPEMKRLIQNPRVSRQEIAQVIADVCGSGVGEEGRNLLRLLAQNRRLHVLPAIADQYEHLRAEAERTVQAELESALPVSDSEQQRIADALTALVLGPDRRVRHLFVEGRAVVADGLLLGADLAKAHRDLAGRARRLWEA